ncbi:acyltransferase family protein [Sphingomonas antarctica]|uniref:acyltransferase family protein n=1 Tax=Sphingomonas antarctica TaxID=2040274 RepID=UPI0039EAE076
MSGANGAAKSDDAGDIAKSFPAVHGVSYRPEIDGLRTIAVGSVILYHAGVPFVPGGYAGVDIFFVISGYLISSIILGDLAQSRFRFLNFYERRIRRIFPALFTVLAASTVGAWFIYSPGQLDEYGKSLVATVAFAANIFFRMRTGYFNADSENSILIHMWSLAVEEQFYVFFPIVLIALHRFRVIGRNPALVAIAVVSLAWCLYQEAVDPVANFFSTPARAWELVAGALVAVNRASWLRLTAVRRDVAVAGRVAELAGAALMLGTIFMATISTRWPGIATIPVVAGTALVILCANSTSILGRALSLKPMVTIGLISYSAYLWHQPLFAIARATSTQALSGWAIGAIIALTFVLAWLSWRFVETPFRSRQKIGRLLIFGFGITVSGCAAAVGLALHFAQGVPSRFDKQTLAMAASIQTSPYREKCNNGEGLTYLSPEKACHFFGSRVTWAVLGDSHGIDLGYAIAERLKGSGQGLVQLTFNGCQGGLTFDSTMRQCSAWTRDAVSWLEQQRGITHVLLAYRHSSHLFGDQMHTYPMVPDAHPPGFELNEKADVAREKYWSDFVTVVQRMRNAGKTVYILQPIPELPMPIERYIFGRNHAAVQPGTSMAYYRARQAWVLARLAELAKRPGVVMIDPVPAVCEATRCLAIQNGMPLYSDDNHLSLPTARKVLRIAEAQGKLP